MRRALHAIVAAAGAVSGELASGILRSQRHHKHGATENHTARFFEDETYIARSLSNTPGESQSQYARHCRPTRMRLPWRASDLCIFDS